jgi:hypothetical protein
MIRSVQLIPPLFVPFALAGAWGCHHKADPGSPHLTSCGAKAISDAKLIATAEAGGTEVALSGMTGCPYCDLEVKGVKGGCCVGLKSADGAFYKLLHSETEEQMAKGLKQAKAKVNVKGKRIVSDGEN